MPPAHTPRRAVALVAGIGAYRNARVPALRYAARDARALARVLTDPEVCDFPDEGVALLTDREAHRAELVSRLSRWLPHVAGDGVELALIYFAGHGVMHRAGGSEEGFLMPHDADPEDVVAHGVSMSDVAKWIGGVNAENVIVCLDCCHAGAVLQPPPGGSLRGAERNLRLRPSVVERLSGSGRFLLASCGQDQESLELEDLEHGLFTYYLLRGLTRDGDLDRDGKVTVEELFRYVSREVGRDASKRGHKQTPWTSATYTEEVVLSTIHENPNEPPALTPANTTEADLIARLSALSRHADAAGLPLLFGAFPHESEAVRGQAQRTLKALDWEWIGRAAEPLARAADQAPIKAVLEGLAALEARQEVVALLERLAELLSGSPRDRALWLLDRKRLALEREPLTLLLQQKHCDYLIERALGPGLYTGAYLARQRVGGLEVVLRILRREFAKHPAVRSDFLGLGISAARLIHPNLAMTREVRVYDDVDLYFTVRDYVDGPTLRDVLAKPRTFEPLAVIKLLRQLLDVLACLHEQGQVHGGVKPSNVFLTRNDVVILGDRSLPLLQAVFGFDAERLAYDYRYVAPELFGGGGRPLLASDVYSMGCLAYELFYGRPPFLAETAFRLSACHDRDPVPLTRGDAVDGWLAGLLAKDPTARPGAEAALAGLAEVETGFRPEPPKPTGPARQTACPTAATKDRPFGSASARPVTGRIREARVHRASWRPDDRSRAERR